MEWGRVFGNKSDNTSFRFLVLKIARASSGGYIDTYKEEDKGDGKEDGGFMLVDIGHLFNQCRQGYCHSRRMRG